METDGTGKQLAVRLDLGGSFDLGASAYLKKTQIKQQTLEPVYP